MFVDGNNDLWELQMTEVIIEESASRVTGESIYQAKCSSCHGKDQRGNGQGIPSLLNVSEKLTQNQFVDILKSGSGRMPSFEHLPVSDIDSLITYLIRPDKLQPTELSEHSEPRLDADKVRDGFPYVPRYINKVWRKVTDQDKYPGVKPPWGTLNAVDLNTGDFIWQVPLGEFPELTAKGIPLTGTENYGGPLVTAGGLVFIAATRDEKFRAFHQKTGQIVWEYQLPAGGFATPISYEIEGRQYIALAVGGGRRLKAGGYYIAFSLGN